MKSNLKNGYFFMLNYVKMAMMFLQDLFMRLYVLLTLSNTSAKFLIYKVANQLHD